MRLSDEFFGEKLRHRKLNKMVLFYAGRLFGLPFIMPLLSELYMLYPITLLW